MGNVLASSLPPKDNVPECVPIPNMPTNVIPSPVDDILDNPGSLEDLHKKCKELFPINFEGAKIAVQKGLNNHFQVTHSINLSSSNPSGYRFGATYVGLQQFGPAESYPVLIGDIDPDGNLNANIYHKFTENVLTKFQAQVQGGKFNAANLITDYRGQNYTATLTLANIDLIQDSGVYVAHYLQNVTKKLALGAELAYQRNAQIPGGQIAAVSVAARYTGDDYCVSGTIGGFGLHLCYYQKASEQLQLGVEWETNLRMQECVASIGYQVDLPKADLVFKGMVDSNWNVGATLDKKLTPMPFSLTLSGVLNHQKNQFRLGLGFIIG